MRIWIPIISSFLIVFAGNIGGNSAVRTPNPPGFLQLTIRFPSCLRLTKVGALVVLLIILAFLLAFLVFLFFVLALGYYCTESSGHNSEYNQWFRKRPDLIEKYCTHGTGWNPGHYAFSLNLHIERDKGGWKKVFEDEMAGDKFDAARSREYAAEIFNARIGDHTPFTFNGNVINEGCLPDLPADCCVEIPVTADRTGYHKQYVGKLPAHLAILLNTTARVENLAVEAAMEKSKEKVYRALCFDPLTSAVCSLAEIREMTNQLFEANREFLKEYK